MAIRRHGRELSPREQAAYVRELTGWTREQYRRERDLLYNRARNFERAAGLARGTLDVADLLARRERGRYYAARTGQAYEPSGILQAVESAPATSVGRALSSRAAERVDRSLYTLANRLMAGVINNSKYAPQIKAELDALRDRGQLTGRAYYDTAEKYARLLEEERSAVQQVNAGIVDPWDAIFFTS